MRLPDPRGPRSEAVTSALSDKQHATAVRTLETASTMPIGEDVVADEDVAITLWTIYELSYRGFDEVDDRWEWDPSLLAVRRPLEDAFEHQLRAEAGSRMPAEAECDADVAEQLFAFIEADRGAGLAGYLQRRATRSQMLEFLIHRSIYHLKESDPHSFVLPRLTGPAKVALAELQYDEYGAGRPARLHSSMFKETLDSCGLDSEYGAYIDKVPALTLAANNAMSLFALNRRLRAADMGHLGAFEATSSVPCRRVAGGLRRLGFGETAAAYFDEHVEADAVHEQLALRAICARIAAEDASLLGDIFFGAAVCLWLEERSGRDMLRQWEQGASSLLEPMDNRQVS
jgi:Iron-containing redox enzyme